MHFPWQLQYQRRQNRNKIKRFIDPSEERQRQAAAAAAARLGL